LIIVPYIYLLTYLLVENDNPVSGVGMDAVNRLTEKFSVNRLVNKPELKLKMAAKMATI